jgi:hypothetical protein
MTGALESAYADREPGPTSSLSVPDVAQLRTRETLYPSNTYQRQVNAYRRYLKGIQPLMSDLFALKDNLDRMEQGFSVQQLAAAVASLHLKDELFKAGATPADLKRNSYQQIYKAIQAMDDAVTYWRTALQYRTTYRSNATDKVMDDELLRVKLSTAVIAIDKLKELEESRKALENTLNEDGF